MANELVNCVTAYIVVTYLDTEYLCRIVLVIIFQEANAYIVLFLTVDECPVHRYHAGDPERLFV